MSKTEVATKIKPNLKISEPSFYKVFYLNDDVTSMNFVVQSLMDYFHHSVDSAVTLTTDIHNNGRAVVAVLPYEVAEQKVTEVTIDARSQGFPLKCDIEVEA